MLLINYDFHDMHCVLTMLRAYPKKTYNKQVIQSIIHVLSEPQLDNTVDNNILRKELRTIETIDKEWFRWVYVDNIYTYGLKVIQNEFCYSFLEKAFRKLLECSVKEDYEQLENLADAENLEATVVARVKAEPRLTMHWNGRTIVDISRAFLDTNGERIVSEGYKLTPRNWAQAVWCAFARFLRIL